MSIQIGSKVKFHYVDTHGEPHRTRDATVVGMEFVEGAPEPFLDLDVEFVTPDDFVNSSPATRQTCVAHSTKEPPESGTWTEE